ncbi:cell division protein ZapE [Aquamicrobium terrae]
MGGYGLTSFRQEYDRGVSTGAIARDPAYDKAVDALDRLAHEIEQTGLASQFLRRLEGKSKTRGVYLWGKVGRGKSMLMNLFFDRVDVRRKRRIHFHAFMADVHARMGSAAVGQEQATSSGGSIATAAESFANDVRLLCLDELEVTDIADAMILGRLFDGLFERGVVLVATSNEPPDGLYANGANRDLFIPFVDRLKGHVEVVEIAGDHDYRLGHDDDAATYLCPINQANSKRFDRLWQKALGGQPEQLGELKVHGRKMTYPRTGNDCLRATFADVCGRALGADDHLALAARFMTVFLENVPVIGREQEDEARRLVTLIDALYEARTCLTVLAAVEPPDIFEERNSDDHRRTVSRLEEMRDAGWNAGEKTARRVR